MYPVRTYLCPRVREGLWLQIPTVDGFVIRVVESCRNQGRRRTLRDSLDRSSWAGLQEINDHAWERMSVGW